MSARTPAQIRALRHALGMTQVQFAAALGVPVDPGARPSSAQVMVSAWETGKHAPSRWYQHRIEMLAEDLSAARTT